MDDLLEVLESLEHSKKVNDNIRYDFLKKLDEINSNLQFLIKLFLSSNKKDNDNTSNLCNNVLEKGFIITNNIKKNLHPNYFILELTNNEYFVTFTEIIELLKFYFEKYDDEEELINNMPKKLLNLFHFLKRNGLVYYDREKRRYKLV
ncbi:MAG: hypothetical protein QXV69_05235 [Sulfolobaceae archaeon]